MIGTLESPTLTRLIARWQAGDHSEPLWRYIERNADMVRMSDLLTAFFEPNEKEN